MVRRLKLSRTCQLIAIAYFCTFLVVLPVLCRNFVFSVYRSSTWTHDALQAKVVQANDAALTEVESYIGTLNTNMTTYRTTKASIVDKINMAMAVITVRRTLGSQPLGYLMRTITTLDRLIKHEEYGEFSTSLFICNVNAGPARHEEVDSLRSSFLVVDRFANASATAAIMDPFEKEKQDYVFCVQQALAGNPELVLIVEDDAVARDDLFPVLHWIFSLQTSTFSFELLSYLKMYYPERWQGYAFSFRTFLELASVFCIGCTLSLAAVAGFSRNRCRRFNVRSNLNVVFWTGLYFVLLALSIGRQHLLELKRIAPSLYSLAAAPACCSPAILYSANFASTMSSHLSANVRCSHLLPLDMALDSYARMTGRLGLLVEPNVFRHIGLISTMKGFSRNLEDFLV